MKRFISTISKSKDAKDSRSKDAKDSSAGYMSSLNFVLEKSQLDETNPTENKLDQEIETNKTVVEKGESSKGVWIDGEQYVKASLRVQRGPLGLDIQKEIIMSLFADNGIGNDILSAMCDSRTQKSDIASNIINILKVTTFSRDWDEYYGVMEPDSFFRTFYTRDIYNYDLRRKIDDSVADNFLLLPLPPDQYDFVKIADDVFSVYDGFKLEIEGFRYDMKDAIRTVKDIMRQQGFSDKNVCCSAFVIVLRNVNKHVKNENISANYTVLNSLQRATEEGHIKLGIVNSDLRRVALLSRSNHSVATYIPDISSSEGVGLKEIVKRAYNGF
jgi:hypothetical protein